MVRPRRFLTLTLQLLLTGVVTWFIIRAVGLGLDDLESVDLARWRIRWAWLLLSSVLLLLAYLYLASLWGLMVRDLGGPSLGAVESLRVWFTANLGRYLPGKVWQVAGLAYLAGKEGVTAATATASALLGQGFSLGGATVVGLGVLLGGGGWAEEVGGGWSAAGLLGLLVVLTFPGILKPLLRLWFRLFRREIPASFRPDQVFGVRWLLLYTLGWSVQGVAFWCLTRGLGLELGAVVGIAAYPAAYVLGYVMIFAPAGIGVREGFLIVFLDPILGAGAAVPAVVSRLWSTLLELVPALGLAGGYLPRPGDRAEGGGGE